MARVREFFSQQLNDFEDVVVNTIQKRGPDGFVYQVIPAVDSILSQPRRIGRAAGNYRIMAHCIVDSILSRLSHNEKGVMPGSGPDGGSFFYIDYLKHLHQDDDFREVLEFVERLYAACRLNAGASFLPFKDFLIHKGMADAVKELWPDEVRGDFQAVAMPNADIRSVRSSTLDRFTPKDEHIEDCITVQPLDDEVVDESRVENPDLSSSEFVQPDIEISDIEIPDIEISDSLPLEPQEETIDEFNRCLESAAHLISRKKAYKKAHKKAEERLNRENATLEKERDKLTQNLAALHRTNDERLAENSALRDRMDNLRRKSSRQRRAIARIEKKQVELKRRINELQTQERANYQLVTEADELRGHEDERRVWLHATKLQNQALKRENTQLRRQYESVTRRIAKMMGGIVKDMTKA